MGREGSQREEGGGGAEAVRFRHPDFALRFYLCKFFYQLYRLCGVVFRRPTVRL